MKIYRFKLKNILFVLILFSLFILSACGGDQAGELAQVAPSTSDQEIESDSCPGVTATFEAPTEVVSTQVSPTETAVSNDDLLADLM